MASGLRHRQAAERFGVSATSVSRCRALEREREGLASARLRGARLGRPPKLDAAQLARARRLLAADAGTTSSVARELGVAPWTLTRSLRRQDAAKP